MRHYVENKRPRGRRAANAPEWEPVPKTAGLDFTMLRFPVDIDDEAGELRLQEFEEANAIGDIRL